MEDILGFMMVIIAIVSAISKNNKKKAAAAEKKQAKKARTLEQSLAEWFEEPRPAPQKQPAQPAASAPAPKPVEIAPVAKTVVQPRVKTTVQVNEKPRAVLGSLGEDTHEGLHPCDEHDDEPMRDSRAMTPMPVEKPGIQLEWTGENMVKAFIMQEVLTRPCDRRRRA